MSWLPMFCTIEHKTGVRLMPSPRTDQLVEIVEPQHIMLITIELVDIAGPVKGASKLKGLGNQFSIKIRET